MMLKILMMAGLIFPIISWLSCIASLFSYWISKKHSSPVTIPIIGPILLTIWVVLDHKPVWLVAIVWIADIGTLMFLAVLPKLIRDWWHTSSFTKILTLAGEKDNQAAIITFHSSGHYLLTKSWNRPRGELGIVSLGEPGTFIQNNNQYELTSLNGIKRILQKVDERTYNVDEKEFPDHNSRDYSIKQWVFKESKNRP